METMTYGAIKEDLKKGKNLEKTLKQLAIKGQSHYYKVALYNMLFHYITFLETIHDASIMEDLQLDEESDTFLRFMLEPLKSYQDLSSLTFNTEELLAFRKTLEIKMTAITSYTDALDQYEYIINRMEGAYMEQQEQIVDDETLAGDLVGFIFSEENNFIISEKMKTVLSQLPIRMTKNKFFAYVDEAMELFKGSSVHDIDQYVAMVKDAIMPDDSKAYQGNFKTIQKTLEALGHTSYKDMDQKTFESMYALKCELSDKLNCLAAVYTLAVNIINNFIELSLCDFTEYYQEDQDIVLAQDMINRMSNRVEQFELDELMAKALEGLEGVIEENLEQAVRFNGLIQQAMDKYQNQLTTYDLTKSYHHVERLAYMATSTSYFIDVLNQEEDIKEERVDDQVLALKKEKLLMLIDKAMGDKSAVYRRSIMSKLFYLLPVSFTTPKDIHDYMLQSLHQCTNKVEKNAAIEILLDFMDTYA
ncbi:hypothetical protein HZI73_13060 [Vallitalea pronyensis]|uniref:Uncharacterized protein n=1 Tax=Vallitalea pronyensis TaxID=1348613 RepID=A0A8J8MK49_9FIRM|nr:hypothetical protein [Vallitalea pronyensis]QUI23160.1 hypothetical protein HZI73_13060 [Vallitalea pronyensis]